MDRTRLSVAIGSLVCGTALGCSLLVPVSDYATESGKGGGSTGGGCDPNCPASSLTDDFSDGGAGPEWTVIEEKTSTADELGGELVLTIDTGYAGYHSVHAYDLRGSSVLCYVPQAPSGNVQTRLRVQAPNDDLIEVEQDRGTMLAHASKAIPMPPQWEPFGTAPYSPTEHAWWRIREAAGMTYWETSSDGLKWTLLGKGPTPIAVDAVHVHLSANAYGAGTGGKVLLDNFNLPPQP